MNGEGRSFTLGEQRVRRSFNPSGNNDVDRIKKLTADLIDFLEEQRTSSRTTPEKARLLYLAQTVYEDAAMWAVKAVTKVVT